MADIWFAGDNHSRFRHIIDAVKRHRPSAIVLLGDIQAKRPLHDELAEILSITQIFWIPGNHDTDSEADYDNLFGSALADRNLHGRVVNVAGVRIAGLGGVFRERVSPPRGGQSDAKRIIYRAAPAERVTIKGSEIVKGWSKVQGEVWKLTLPNTFFGGFNPYRDVIHGDWFDGKE